MARHPGGCAGDVTGGGSHQFNTDLDGGEGANASLPLKMSKLAVPPRDATPAPPRDPRISALF